MPGLGAKVRDGKFQFVVKSWTCGEQSVGSGILEEDANGQFCIAKITVKNIGDEAQMFADSEQLALAGGKEYSADSAAGMALNEDLENFLEDINPGNSVTVDIAFDVPKKVKIDELELHDSSFSDGVVVAVS